MTVTLLFPSYNHAVWHFMHYIMSIDWLNIAGSKRMNKILHEARCHVIL